MIFKGAYQISSVTDQRFVSGNESELRCKMLHNRFAGDALKKVDQLFMKRDHHERAIVLCKGVNDGEELNTAWKLSEYAPVLQSVSVT